MGIKKMIIEEKEKVEEEIMPDGKLDGGEDLDDFDADEDAMLFAEGDTEEEMSDEWLMKMMEMDEEKEEKKKIEGTNAKKLKDKKDMEASEEKKTEKDKDKKPTIKEE